MIETEKKEKRKNEAFKELMEISDLILQAVSFSRHTYHITHHTSTEITQRDWANERRPCRGFPTLPFFLYIP